VETAANAAAKKNFVISDSNSDVVGPYPWHGAPQDGSVKQGV
jgi:hypothetical protein